MRLCRFLRTGQVPRSGLLLDARWKSTPATRRKVCREPPIAIKALIQVSGSSFLQQTLSTGYPRLLRLFHSFFTKIAVHTDTVYTQTQQR